MRCIFVDNFRGFKKTLLPIKDVNFFVGENSTGKTSILALIYLFNSAALWIGGRFTNEDEQIDLGNYDDIVSMHATEKNCFSVGAMFSSEEQNSGNYDAFLMTFAKVEGMPKIKRYTLITENKKVNVKFQNSKVMYKIEQMEAIDRNYDNIERMFLALADCHKKEERGFRELKKVGMGRQSMGTLNSIIMSMLKEEPISKVRYYSYPAFYDLITWMAPIRTKPLDIYVKYGILFSPEGRHTPYKIKKLLEDRATAQDFEKFVKEFGKESGLFDSVVIKKYGKPKIAPFEVDIILSGKQTNITNVGYGVSQILPIIVEIFSDPEGAAFAIQQPEIHLHPKAQAALGDLLFNLTVLEKKQFIVETHSDFIIDRFRMNYMKKKQKEKPESQIIYFENSSEGNVLNVIDIAEDGSLPKEQPRGYREFFLKEDLDVLGY